MTKPMLKSKPIHTDRFSTDRFSYRPDENLFIAAASDLGLTDEHRHFTLVSASTGDEVMVAREHIEARGGDGLGRVSPTVLYADYLPTDLRMRDLFKVRVLND